MERRMEAKEPKWGGTVTQSGDGDAIQFLPASEQFSTRSCARCVGLLVNDWCYDLANTGEHISTVLRCVQCGHRVDPVILQNQIRPAVESQHVRSVRQRYSTRTVMLNELA